MPRPEGKKRGQKAPSPHELLEFYDDFTELNACIIFVLQACASGLANGGADERVANGAVFCVQWLNDRTRELERRVEKIRRRVRGAARS